jgi:putative phosphoesterase
MIIGILSDTHDDMAAIKKAVEMFNAENVSRVVHAGDIVSPFTFDAFRKLQCGIYGVFGNNDGDRLLIRQKSEGTFSPQPLILTLHGRRIVVVHEPDLVDALADSGHFDLVVYGHTHRSHLRKVKDTLVINPGKTARLHKGGSTIAILDTESMEARIVSL